MEKLLIIFLNVIAFIQFEINVFIVASTAKETLCTGYSFAPSLYAVLASSAIIKFTNVCMFEIKSNILQLILVIFMSKEVVVHLTLTIIS